MRVDYDEDYNNIVRFRTSLPENYDWTYFLKLWVGTKEFFDLVPLRIEVKDCSG
jgi:hypothetical protein